MFVSCANPKFETLQILFSSTNIFLASKSLWITCRRFKSIRWISKWGLQSRWVKQICNVITYKQVTKGGIEKPENSDDLKRCLCVSVISLSIYLSWDVIQFLRLKFSVNKLLIALSFTSIPTGFHTPLNFRDAPFL